MSERQNDLLEQLAAGLRGVGGDVELSAFAARVGTTRFAASQATQTGDVERLFVQVRVADGGAIGTARTDALDAASIARGIETARALASAAARHATSKTTISPSVAPFDDGTIAAPTVDAWDEATACATPAERASILKRAFDRIPDPLGAAGILAITDGAQAVATSAGARRAYRFTSFKLDLIAAESHSGGGSGYAHVYARRAAACDPLQLADEAVRRAQATRAALALPPGEYDVILEPAAVAEVLEWLGIASLGARALFDDSSCLSGRIGQRVTGSPITLYDDAHDPDPVALRAPFDAEGTPKRRVTFLDGGVARDVVCDRELARRHSLRPTGHRVPLGDGVVWDTCAPQHLHMAPGDDSEADLLARVERGLWVTRFHYVNGLLDTRRARMTGMTRDGLLLIENGRVGRGVRNLRFTEALLDALARTDGISRARRAVAPSWSDAGGCIVAPTLLIRRFTFTGASKPT